MSQRFIRCPHCGMPHDGLQVICPSTGKAIRRQVSSAAAAGRARVRSAPPRRPSSRRAARRATSSARPSAASTVVRAVLGEGGHGHGLRGRAPRPRPLRGGEGAPPDAGAKKDAVRRFHQEARAAGAIGHPNICEVYDLGTLDDGSPYLVMERLVGETLADRIATEGGLPFDDVIDMLVQVLSGLVAAHEKGIVHRDIKPENVFLTKRVGCPPLVKLLDFGVSKVIAAAIGHERRRTSTSRAPGW